MCADSVGFSAGSGSSTSTSTAKTADAFKAAANSQKQVPDAGVDNTPAKPPTSPKKQEPVEAGLKPGEKKPAETKRSDEKKPPKLDPNNNPSNPNASGWSQSNSGNSGGQDKEEKDQKKQKQGSGGGNGTVQGPQEANAWDVGWAGYTSALNAQSITSTTTPKGPPVVDPLLGSVVTGANGGGKVETVDAAAAAAELAAQGGPSLVDMATLDPSVNVSQAVAGAALAQFDPASMELPQVQAEMAATLQVHQALLDDLTAQSDAHKDNHLDLHKSVVEKNGQNLTAAESSYAAERTDYAEKIAAAQALVDADKAALQVVEQLLADPNGPPKPVGAFYTAEAAPNMAYQVPLYQRPIVEGGKTIGVELIDLTNPFDIRYYQGYSPDVDTAMQGALGDYQFIRPLPQGTLMVAGSGSPVAYATGAATADAKLVEKNKAALASLQAGALADPNDGHPGWTGPVGEATKATFWAGVIPWSMAGGVQAVSQMALNRIFAQSENSSAGGTTLPPYFQTVLGPLGLVSGLMSFINDVGSDKNQSIGALYTTTQGLRDINAMYRSAAVTYNGYTGTFAALKKIAAANPWLGNLLNFEYPAKAVMQGNFGGWLPPAKPIPTTWVLEGLLGTAAAFAQYGAGGNISMDAIAKRNGAIVGSWTNALMVGSPAFTGQFSAFYGLPKSASALNWALVAGMYQQTGVGQYSRAEALGMLPQVGGHGEWRELYVDPWAYGTAKPVDPRLTSSGHVGGVVEDSILDGDPWYQVAWNAASDAVSSVAGVIGRGFINAMAGDLRPAEQFRQFVIETAGEQYVDETFLREIDYFVRYAPDDPVFAHMVQEETARIEAIAAANGP